MRFTTLLLNDGSIVPLKYVEQITYLAGEEHTIDILKDDLTIEIVMISGRTHRVSMKQQSSGDYLWDITYAERYRDAILRHWKHLNGDS